jgi:hypothetical protein
MHDPPEFQVNFIKNDRTKLQKQPTVTGFTPISGELITLPVAIPMPYP